MGTVPVSPLLKWSENVLESRPPSKEDEERLGKPCDRVVQGRIFDTAFSDSFGNGEEREGEYE